MKYHLTPASADFSYSFFYKEPMMDLIKQGPRIDFLTRLLKEFAISIDTLKFDAGKPSGKAIEFSKFYDRTWFNVSIGIERFEVIFQPLPGKELIKKSCMALYNLFGNDLLSWQEMNINSHHTVKEGVNALLESLNPYCPPDLLGLVKGRGVSYEFDIPEQELTVRISVANSIIVKDAAYVALNGRFTTSRYNFEQAYDILLENSNRFANSFNIETGEVV
jgi:hypothetical protein